MQADNCLRLGNQQIQNAIRKYTDEMTGLRNGTISPFRCKKRAGTFANAENTRDAIVKEECARLQEVVDSLRDWPQSGFASLNVPQDPLLPADIPPEMISYDKREPSLRRSFWKKPLSKKVIVSYCRAHVPHLEIGQLLDKRECFAFKRKICIQLQRDCNVAF